MSESLNEWAILELMGHRKMAGLVSEVTIAGGAFIRIDVPGIPREGEIAPIVATQFYSPSAVYCITPVKEELARNVAAASQVAPVSRWDLPALEPGRRVDWGSAAEEHDDDV